MLNYQLNFNLNHQIISSFNDLSNYCGWHLVPGYNDKFYNKNDKDITVKLSNLEQIKIIRPILENAIRESISKYMPAETTLWKINYSGN